MGFDHSSAAPERRNFRIQIATVAAARQVEPNREPRTGDADRIVCHCFGTTAFDVTSAIQELKLSTLEEVCRSTGAGNGCTCCRKQLLGFLDHAKAEINSCAPITEIVPTIVSPNGGLLNMSSRIESNPVEFSQSVDAAKLDCEIKALIDNAKLSPNANRFFTAAKASKTVDAQAALQIAHYWRETTKTFMFTTIEGIGSMAKQADLEAAPPEHFLDVIQTAFRVIGDDLNNVLPVFKAVAPEGAGGIHYVWWERSILRPLADRLGLNLSSELPPLPENVRSLLDNMRRLSSSPLGTAVQLRVVEAIALDICIAFKRVFPRVAIDGAKVFTTADQLAWMNSHIQAEVAHNEQVSDHDTGMASLADTAAKQKEMLRLTAEYVCNWNAALEDFASALG